MDTCEYCGKPIENEPLHGPYPFEETTYCGINCFSLYASIVADEGFTSEEQLQDIQNFINANTTQEEINQ